MKHNVAHVFRQVASSLVKITNLNSGQNFFSLMNSAYEHVTMVLMLGGIVTISVSFKTSFGDNQSRLGSLNSRVSP